MLWRVGAVLLILGGVFGFLGFQDWRLSRASSDKPEEITLKALIDRGADGNPNVVVKDFRVLDDLIVYETQRGSPSWTKAWIPAVPAGEAAGAGRPNIRALIVSTKAKNKGELDGRCKGPQLRAMVVNRIQSLGRSERKLLEEGYPGTNFDSCLLIHEGREPSGGTWLAVCFGLAALLILGGAGVLLLAFVRHNSQPASKPKKKKRPAEDEEDEEEDDRPRRRRRPRDEDDD